MAAAATHTLAFLFNSTVLHCNDIGACDVPSSKSICPMYQTWMETVFVILAAGNRNPPTISDIWSAVICGIHTYNAWIADECHLEWWNGMYLHRIARKSTSVKWYHLLRFPQGIEQLKKEEASWTKKSRWKSIQAVFGRFSLAWFSPFTKPTIKSKIDRNFYSVWMCVTVPPVASYLILKLIYVCNEYWAMMCAFSLLNIARDQTKKKKLKHYWRFRNEYKFVKNIVYHVDGNIVERCVRCDDDFRFSFWYS